MVVKIAQITGAVDCIAHQEIFLRPETSEHVGRTGRRGRFFRGSRSLWRVSESAQPQLAAVKNAHTLTADKYLLPFVPVLIFFVVLLVHLFFRAKMT
jgi:hypothetical protein